jgi:hypothetical protein
MSGIRRDLLARVKIVGRQSPGKAKYRPGIDVSRKQFGGDGVECLRHSIDAAVANRFNHDHCIFLFKMRAVAAVSSAGGPPLATEPGRYAP